MTRPATIWSCFGSRIDDPHPAFTLTCDGVASATAAFEPPLSKLHEGESVAPEHLVFGMKDLVAIPPRQCQLTIASGGKDLGTFCVASTITTPGACQS